MGKAARKPEGDACTFKVCVDPRTGRTVLRPADGCPEGFIEKVEKSMRTEGVEVVYPRKVESKEE